MDAVLASYHRIRARNFASRFYELLLPAHPEIARHFAQTDVPTQAKLLEHGVFMLLQFADGNAVGRLALQRLAIKHDRAHLGVAPALYPIWIDCMVQTASELDALWTPELARAWRAKLAAGTRFMGKHFEAPQKG